MSISSETPAKGVALRSSNKSVLEKVIIDVAHQCNVHPSQVEDLYPCTQLQHGLLVLCMASTAPKAAYVAQFVFRLNEQVDTGRMKAAWEVVIQRNAILRTRIVNRDARTFQVVLKAGSPDWVDCTDLPQYLQNEGQRSMQYGEVLSRLAMSETYMVWTAHHSVYDGFSVELLLKDIATVYEGGNLPTHTPFKNFIKHVQHVDQAQCRSFWASLLSNKDVLQFPPIRKPNQRPRPNRTMEHHALSVAVAASQVTTATIVQAAWMLVLSSQLSSATVSFGLTVSGRNTPVAGIETIMGPTIATVPVCYHINLDQSVAQYLQDVQRYFTQMIPYQHVGLQKIKEINAEACEFQNLLAIHHAEHAGPHSTYDSLFKREEVETEKDFFNYAMILQCSLNGSGALRAHATFDEDLVDTLQMQRLLCQLEHTIRQLGSSDGGRILRAINLVAPEDLQQIQRWNTKPDSSSGFPLQEIQGHFHARPRSTAICSWDGQMTYSELDTLSSKLAEYLVSRHGIGPEVIVPLCFDKSQWMIVAVVAVMRAGGAFTLLDPTYPIERLKRIIKSTGCKTVLVSTSCDSMFSSSLVVDAEIFKSIASAGAAGVNLQVNHLDLLSVENAMYVVFTSGSTGGTYFLNPIFDCRKS
ncbi:hypothetical protein MMC22_003907 [Lobaria immixta]|nr:hypothetical protein [Lobaria immixta]